MNVSGPVKPGFGVYLSARLSLMIATVPSAPCVTWKTVSTSPGSGSVLSLARTSRSVGPLPPGTVKWSSSAVGGLFDGVA